MTHLEARIRRDLLGDVLRNVRKTWACLASGDIPAAVDYERAATRTLAHTVGLYSRRAPVGSTATLERVLINLAIALDDALAVSLRGPEVHPSDLVPHLFESLKVLQREGVQVEDEQLMNRARNQAMNLAGHFVFTRR